ncbi:MOS1T transposase, partial [Pseudoatta argentina]
MSIFVPNKVYLRGILLHYFIQKKSAAEAHRILVQTYGDNALSDTTCSDWFRRFKNNDFELEDKERSGAPKKFEDKELEQLLDEDPSQTLSELGKILQVDESTVSKGLGMIQKQGHWVPYELKLRDVITGDRYRLQLMRLSRALKEKRPLYAQRHDNVILLHDNARPHVAKPVKPYLETLKWEVLPYPLYSPDINGRYGAEAMIAKPNFHSRSVIAENLIVVEMRNLEVKFDKPIYVGMCILNISKVCLYEFHHEDSLIYHIECDDVYETMKRDIARFNTSDYPVDNMYSMPLANRKVYVVPDSMKTLPWEHWRIPLQYIICIICIMYMYCSICCNYVLLSAIYTFLFTFIQVLSVCFM